MPTGCCLLPCMTVCWPTRSWQSWRAAPTRGSLPRASSPRLLILPHRTAISKRRTPSLPCLRIPASTRLLCQLWQSGYMENSAKSKTVFLFICLKQPASTGCSSRVWVLPNKYFAKQNKQMYIRLHCLRVTMKPFNVLPKFENHFAIETVRFQVQLEAGGYFSAKNFRVCNRSKQGELVPTHKF